MLNSSIQRRIIIDSDELLDSLPLFVVLWFSRSDVVVGVWNIERLFGVVPYGLSVFSHILLPQWRLIHHIMKGVALLSFVIAQCVIVW